MKFAAIFDMDGVLIDYKDLLITSQANLLKGYGIPSTPGDIKNYLEKPLSYNLEDWSKKYNFFMNEETYREISNADGIRLLKKQGPDSHLVKLLEELEKNNIPRGIGTSSGRKRAKEMLHAVGLRKYFQFLVCEEDVHNHKPASDVFLKVARKIGIPPERCVVFEDSSDGVLAGKNANMKVIGYLNKHNSPEDLKGSDIIISSFMEVNRNKLSRMFL
jgi:HAD superfamily hydrolase (TIGR01509 family)